eukprot:TRINITY_DN6073_c0_g1_i2.p1 TRINITY_DN6073_c0_g1~~TRINITY_DN6073_c0_g1_i2.p1  ORF type:complete len:174 (-),score=49.28 TRINITY_DN6073_c0_g1_i2:43-564(-)
MAKNLEMEPQEIAKVQTGMIIHYQLLRGEQVVNGIPSEKMRQVVQASHIRSNGIRIKIRFHRMKVFKELVKQLGINSSDLSQFLEGIRVRPTPKILKSVQWGPYTLVAQIENDVYMSNPFLITSTGHMISEIVKAQGLTHNPLASDHVVPRKKRSSSSDNCSDDASISKMMKT